ncbi:MAG TPA: RidA family protein [Planctomycetaceae bacterium]|jgi:enamine deaminase RidA (YjgF/YER057c/UK114 family)|nr:RidA family protein [Planctomycetaceae bacterium]
MSRILSSLSRGGRNSNEFRYAVWLLAAAALTGLHSNGGAVAEDSAPSRPLVFDADPATGSAAAVLVGPVALGHTAQIFPVDGNGKIPSADSARGQIDAVFSNLERMLAPVSARWEDVVKLNVYAADVETVAEVRTALAEKFPGAAKPAVSFVVGTLARPDARVALDAVIACPTAEDGSVRRLRAKVGAGATPAGSELAVLPPGPRVYISGQAEGGKDMAEATQRTMESLKRTLAHLGHSLDDVVQVKSFLGPIGAVAEAEREIVKFFGGKNTPPLVFVEWSSSLPIEIEIVARGGVPTARTAAAIEYLTPPGMTASPVFCRVTRVNAPETIYISGLFGKSNNNGARETQEIFDSLKTILRKTRSDFQHLAKATYYVSTEEASTKLNEIRPKFYDPMRPPAASKAMVAGTGLEGRTITLDMIAVRNPK